MITQTQCTRFKLNLLKGLEDFSPTSPYVYKLALYTSQATLNAATTQYTSDNEINGVGYIAGGKELTPTVVDSEGTTAYISFEDIEWNPANFTANGGLIYNSSTGAAVAVLSFGSDKTTTSTFPVMFPSATASTAIIRIS